MSQLNEVIKTAINNLQSIVDADTIIGKPITAGGTTIIPVSKVSIGIATGGVDHVAKANADKQEFYGGNGAGLSVSPVAFIVISANGDAKILNMNAAPASAAPANTTIGTIDSLVTKAPDIIAKIKDIFTEKADKDEIKEEEDD